VTLQIGCIAMMALAEVLKPWPGGLGTMPVWLDCSCRGKLAALWLHSNGSAGWDVKAMARWLHSTDVPVTGMLHRLDWLCLT
jgi:hypothetical protein